MLQFPSTIKNPSSLSEDILDAAIRSDMESGMPITRAKFTRQPMTFTIRWNNLTRGEYDIILEFYRQTKGGAERFTWTHPETGRLYLVRFKSKESFNFISPFYWAGGVVLEEA